MTFLYRGIIERLRNVAKGIELRLMVLGGNLSLEIAVGDDRIIKRKSGRSLKSTKTWSEMT